MKKSKEKNPLKPSAEIPARLMAGLRQVFQKQSAPDSACPEPEQVISSALEELASAEQQEVQKHLLTCRSCLDLYLDVRLAVSEAASPAGEGLEEVFPEELTKVSWLAGILPEGPGGPAGAGKTAPTYPCGGRGLINGLSDCLRKPGILQGGAAPAACPGTGGAPGRISPCGPLSGTRSRQTSPGSAGPGTSGQQTAGR